MSKLVYITIILNRSFSTGVISLCSCLQLLLHRYPRKHVFPVNLSDYRPFSVIPSLFRLAEKTGSTTVKAGLASRIAQGSILPFVLAAIPAVFSLILLTVLPMCQKIIYMFDVYLIFTRPLLYAVLYYYLKLSVLIFHLQFVTGSLLTSQVVVKHVGHLMAGFLSYSLSHVA